MKNKIAILVAVIILIVFWGFSAKSQYSWSQRFQKQMGTDWAVFDEQKNSAEFIYPYTFFNPPINRLGLIQLSSIQKIGDGIYQYRLMWADGLIGNSMPTEVFIYYSDCKLSREGSLKEGLDRYSNIEDLQWKSPDDNPYVTNTDAKKELLETFNQKCSILHSYKK